MLCGAAVLIEYFDNNNNMWSAGGGNGVGVLYMVIIVLRVQYVNLCLI